MRVGVEVPDSGLQPGVENRPQARAVANSAAVAVGVIGRKTGLAVLLGKYLLGIVSQQMSATYLGEVHVQRSSGVRVGDVGGARGEKGKSRGRLPLRRANEQRQVAGISCRLE